MTFASVVNNVVEASTKEQKTLYSECVRSVMLHGSETWTVKEEHMIRLERRYARMVRNM